MTKSPGKNKKKKRKDRLKPRELWFSRKFQRKIKSFCFYAVLYILQYENDFVVAEEIDEQENSMVFSNND